MEHPPQASESNREAIMRARARALEIQKVHREFADTPKFEEFISDEERANEILKRIRLEKEAENPGEEINALAEEFIKDFEEKNQNEQAA